LASAEKFPLQDERFDVAFMVAVLGEVPLPGRCCAEAYRVLRPGALFSVTELPGDPDHLSIEEVRGLAYDAGFAADKEFGTDENFTINFRKAVAQASIDF
jgi:ubiquinone/menaquinone biosynthesis C-methylase UbiE